MDNKEFRQLLLRRSYKFSLDIIRFVGGFNRTDAALQIVTRQLIRSATSIGANIIEAQASSSKRDFVNFLNHALKSANETIYWLCLLRDGFQVDKNKVFELLKEANELAKILGSSLLSLKGKKKL